jgi:hypothetical protein
MPISLVLTSRAVVKYWEEAHDGPGWYYYDEELPEEGSVGRFDTKEQAEAHAREHDYIVDSAAE